MVMVPRVLAIILWVRSTVVFRACLVILGLIADSIMKRPIIMLRILLSLY